MRLEDIYDADDEQERLARVLDPRFLRMLDAWQELVASQFPELQDFRLDDEATRMILSTAAERVVLIDSATRDAIREQLKVGQARGYSAHELAYGVPAEGYRGIDHLFTTTWKGRAEVCARTELAHAQNVASLDRYAATGLVDEVQIVEDEDTDEPCASRNGKVVPISDKPGLLHPQCQMGLIPRVREGVA
jgi:hypothetical protein